MKLILALISFLIAVFLYSIAAGKERLVGFFGVILIILAVAFIYFWGSGL